VLLLYSGVDGTLFHVLAASLFAVSAAAAASGASPRRKASADPPPERLVTPTGFEPVTY
jgi:hypothetical protein